MALPKKISTIKRFGTRYGRTYKHKLGMIERIQKESTLCPYCLKKKVKRIAMGIWKCTKCSAKFTGKAYTISKKKITAEELFRAAKEEDVLKEKDALAAKEESAETKEPKAEEQKEEPKKEKKTRQKKEKNKKEKAEEEKEEE